jgi:hypothetical protein
MTQLRNSMAATLGIKSPEGVGRAHVNIRTLTGKVFTFHIEVSKVTARALKDRIERLTGIPWEAQRLFHGTHEVSNSDSMSTYCHKDSVRNFELIEAKLKVLKEALQKRGTWREPARVAQTLVHKFEAEDSGRRLTAEDKKNKASILVRKKRHNKSGRPAHGIHDHRMEVAEAGSLLLTSKDEPRHDDQDTIADDGDDIEAGDSTGSESEPVLSPRYVKRRVAGSGRQADDDTNDKQKLVASDKSDDTIMSSNQETKAANGSDGSDDGEADPSESVGNGQSDNYETIHGDGDGAKASDKPSQTHDDSGNDDGVKNDSGFSKSAASGDGRDPKANDDDVESPTMLLHAPVVTLDDERKSSAALARARSSWTVTTTPKILARTLYVREEDGTIHVEKQQVATLAHPVILESRSSRHRGSNDDWNWIDRGIPLDVLLAEDQ